MAHILANGKGVQKRFSRFERGFAQKHPGWHEETGSQPTLKELLGRGLTVLVAPHHGLESCYSKELFAVMRGGKPSLNVLSERRKAHNGDGTTDARYQSEVGARGLSVDVNGNRAVHRSVSTKNGHHILIKFTGSRRAASVPTPESRESGQLGILATAHISSQPVGEYSSSRRC